MDQLLSSPLRIGLVALGLLAGLTPASAVPASIAAPPILPVASGPVTLGDAASSDGTVQNVAERRWIPRHGGGGPRWNGGGGRWNNGGHWNNGGNWNHRPNWNNNWRPRPYWNNGFYGGWGFFGPQVYLQLGQPYYGGQYYAPPRRAYRGDILLSAEHVQWCYNRWRSYRASDNTYQPNNGPRRLCTSPYS